MKLHCNFNLKSHFSISGVLLWLCCIFQHTFLSEHPLGSTSVFIVTSNISFFGNFKKWSQMRWSSGSLFSSFANRFPFMEKPGKLFTLAKCIKSTCGRVTFYIKMQVNYLVFQTYTNANLVDGFYIIRTLAINVEEIFV